MRRAGLKDTRQRLARLEQLLRPAPQDNFAIDITLVTGPDCEPILTERWHLGGRGTYHYLVDRWSYGPANATPLQGRQAEEWLEQIRRDENEVLARVYNIGTDYKPLPQAPTG